jgi:aminocarboxymuconate-semialdehyde decarboxylase
MLGTDQPIPWEEHPVDHVFATEGLNDAQRIGILGKNAQHLLDLKLS